jgi:toxin FitB
MFATDFAGRIFSFDQPPVQAYAQIAATRRRAGRLIARSRDAGGATRNIADFVGCGIGLIDPWRP